jgi:starch phosphorylase
MATNREPRFEQARAGAVESHLKKAAERMGEDALKQSFLDHLLFGQGKDQHSAHRRDLYLALASTVRDRLVQKWIATRRLQFNADPKRIYYLSLEFLMGRALSANLINMGIYDLAREALAEVGIDLADLAEQEPDAGLGNGGLGRLAACFLDSMATLGLAGMGYGIRYEFGIFDQMIRDGWQVERPDQWLQLGNPWELPHLEFRVPVKFYGRCVNRVDEMGRFRVEWVDAEEVVGVPYDNPIVGYRCDTVNTLRLWRARATDEFDLSVFNSGDYLKAVRRKELSESISKVLYPNDASPEGKELRLKQQYFFVACSIADIVRRYTRAHVSFDHFPDKVAIQLNDTHPAIAVAELMRVFVDEQMLPWDGAWKLVQRTFSYTNHTLLSEALETWPVGLLEHVLPRHMQIVNEINARFLEGVSGDDRKRRMSIIAEGPEKRVRMAHLAVVGSHKVNGVAELHTELLKKDLLPDFDALWPDKIVNRTNGVTPRRWLLQANPRLAALLTEALGDGWPRDLGELRGLVPLAEDAAFRARFREAKRANKQDLAALVHRETGATVPVESLFDVQVKRIHEYKRQLLSIVHTVVLYQRLKRGMQPKVPRTVIFGGKAAPGYWNAKLTVKLASAVGAVVNADPAARGKLAVVFLPNYRVSLAEKIFPGSDLSEQISTAGKEASGTGNMKFSLNGALTIGTLDGANIEIREEVGAENFFLFGLTAEEVKRRRQEGYFPRRHYDDDAELRAALDAIGGGAFSPEDAHLFRPLVDHLLGWDEYFLMADFASYREAQYRVSEAYADPERWTRMAILNVARMGKFSSDRAIREYAEGIWNAKPVE